MDNTENQEIGNRLKNIFSSLSTTPKKVAELLGVTPSRVHNLTLGYSLPSFLTVVSLLELFPNINLEYLFTGRGYPLKSGGSTLFSPENQVIELRYYDTESSFVVSESVAEYGKKIPIVSSGVDLSGCVVCDVLDNSMSPQLHKGQKLVLRPVDSGGWDWMRSGVYAVRYSNYLAVRRIKENDLRENGKLILYADNEKDGAIHLKRSDIISIYSVIQVFGSVE